MKFKGSLINAPVRRRNMTTIIWEAVVSGVVWIRAATQFEKHEKTDSIGKDIRFNLILSDST